MTINHRVEAEKHLSNAARHLTEGARDMRIAEVSAWIGQGHATLARDEEQTGGVADLQDAAALTWRRNNAMRSLVAEHIAKALASREKDRWKAGIDLTKALDEADCSVGDLVDDRLTEDGWDPRSAYKTLASLVPHDDPWATKPDITADIPNPVRRVLADYLAAALLSEGDAQGVAQTITFALKAAGADLTGDIEKRITELTLGPDPSDPPF